MFPLPPLSLSGGTTASGPAGGFAPWEQGSWSVNVAGSGRSYQGATAGAAATLSPLLVAAAAAGAAWLLLRALRK